MISIRSASLSSYPVVFSQIIRQQLDVGVSTGKYGRIIHLPDAATQQQQDTALAWLQNEDTLTVNATKTTVTVGVVDDSAITCTELPTVFDYRIYRQITAPFSRVEFELSGSVSDGSLELTAQEAGTYIIAIIEQGGTRTGYIEIEAVEA